VETIARIRREHREGKTIKEIARDLRLSRNTVRKAVRASDADCRYERKQQPRPKTGPFSHRLEEFLEQNEGLCAMPSMHQIQPSVDGDAMKSSKRSSG
jgi:transposase